MFKKRNFLTGFTLIEVVITIAFFSVLAVSVSLIFLATLRAWHSGESRSELRHYANLAIERMVRELSMASSISIAQSGKITFTADVDDDGSNESITFEVSNNDDLERTITGRSIVLAGKVTSFSLGYYLEGDNDTLLTTVTGPTRDDIRIVVINLTLNKADETVALSSSAYIRNL